MRQLRDLQIAVLDGIFPLRDQHGERGVKLQELFHTHLRDFRQRHARIVPCFIEKLTALSNISPRSEHADRCEFSESLPRQPDHECAQLLVAERECRTDRTRRPLDCDPRTAFTDPHPDHTLGQ